MQKTILIVDDQQHVLDSLTLLLETVNFDVISAVGPQETLQCLRHRKVDLVLMDMNYSLDTTSGKEGLELVTRIRELEALLPIVVMTAWASIELSVQAMKLGADDFVEKPWKNRRLLNLLNNQLHLYQEKRENRNLKALLHLNQNLTHSQGQNQSQGHTHNQQQKQELIANSPSMHRVLQLIERTAQSDANILLTGESGVGKSMIASYIHNCSQRQQHPFVSVNMGALTDTLFASELFGHVKGAFTDAKSQRIGRFEMAEKGTLFMDEIANIPPEQQAKLLRVLESGEFEAIGSSRTQNADVRIVSATNDDLANSVKHGQFRQDLLYRLNTITIDIPPLRERKEDIETLTQYFLNSFKVKYRRENVVLSEAAQLQIMDYQWPGNIRELAHCIERAVLVCAQERIMPVDLGLQLFDSGESYEAMTLEEAEKQLIIKALKRNDNNVVNTAEQLGISRNALYRRVDKYHIDVATAREPT